METQLELDCYHKAEEGEPTFTLLARDPVAPNIVKLWAALRIGDLPEASYHFTNLLSIANNRYSNGEKTEQDKIDSALTIANEMNNWQRK